MLRNVMRFGVGFILGTLILFSLPHTSDAQHVGTCDDCFYHEGYPYCSINGGWYYECTTPTSAGCDYEGYCYFTAHESLNVYALDISDEITEQVVVVTGWRSRPCEEKVAPPAYLARRDGSEATTAEDEVG